MAPLSASMPGHLDRVGSRTSSSSIVHGRLRQSTEPKSSYKRSFRFSLTVSGLRYRSSSLSNKRTALFPNNPHLPEVALKCVAKGRSTYYTFPSVLESLASGATVSHMFPSPADGAMDSGRSPGSMYPDLEGLSVEESDPLPPLQSTVSSSRIHPPKRPPPPRSSSVPIVSPFPKVRVRTAVKLISVCVLCVNLQTF